MSPWCVQWPLHSFNCRKTLSGLWLVLCLRNLHLKSVSTIDILVIKRQKNRSKSFSLFCYGTLLWMLSCFSHEGITDLLVYWIVKCFWIKRSLVQIKLNEYVALKLPYILVCVNIFWQYMGWYAGFFLKFNLDWLGKTAARLNL